MIWSFGNTVSTFGLPQVQGSENMDLMEINMQAATIKLFLPTGEATGIRTAEISNWTGKGDGAEGAEDGGREIVSCWK